MTKRYLDVIQAHDESVRTLAYSPNGRFIVSGGGDGKVRIWDLCRTRLVNEFAAKSSVQCVGYSPDGKSFAFMNRDGEVRLYDVNDGTKPVMETKFSPTAGFAYSPDSRLLVGANTQGRVFLFNVQTKNPLYVHKHSSEHEINSVAMSADGRYVASGGSDLVIRLYDMQEGKEKACMEFHKNPITSLAFSPDSKTLGSSDNGAMMAYWDLSKSGAEALKSHFSWAGHAVNAVAFSPDGLIFASGGNDSRLKLFEVNNGNKRLEDLEGHQRYIYAVVFSPDGKFAATGAADGTIRVWNIKKPHYVA